MQDKKTQQLLNEGYVVLKNVIPPNLVEECRLAFEPLNQLARAQHGWQAQRFQPISSAPNFETISSAPNYRAGLRSLQSVLESVRSLVNFDIRQQLALPYEYTCCNPDTCGVLINPGPVDCDPDQIPHDYVMPLHRDWFFQKPHADASHLLDHWANNRCWHQFNLPLYEDSCLYLVPGSTTSLDLAEEAKRSQRRRYFPAEPDHFKSTTDYVKGFWDGAIDAFGAQRVVVTPGNMVIYNGLMLHGSANWVDRPRLTLHDFCDTPEFREFRAHQYKSWAVGKETGAQPWWEMSAEDIDRKRETPTVHV